MTGGMKKTFDVLRQTENEAFVQVLIPALDSPTPSIAEAALRALLDRRSLAGQHEIIRRLHTIDNRWKAIISEGRGSMSQALRDAVLNTDPQICRNGCDAILWFREYDVIPTLVNAAEDESNPHADLAATTLLSLCELLYEELAAPRDYQLRRDPQLVRRHVTGSLEDSVGRFNKHKRPEIIESFLMLAGRDNATLMQILLDPLHISFVAMIQTLTHSSRPGVMRLVLSHLDNSQAPTSLISVMSHRCDKRFVEHLLRKIGHTPSSGAAVNLKRMDSIAWLKGSTALLDGLDDSAQHSAVQMVLGSRMKSADAYEVIQHLALRGKVGGRRAAVAGLPRFTGTEANQLALQALKDPDPQVQASALGQLRQRGIPGALPTLLSFIDSPHHLVRQAARESLGEFGFAHYLAAFDMLEAEVARCTGLLVKRIDVNTVPLLRQEMQSTSGKRRLRALAVARVIEAVPQVEETILELARQDDHLLRAAAATALADSASPAARALLEEARYDSSLAVQEAALASLAEIDRRGRTVQTRPETKTPDSPSEVQS